MFGAALWPLAIRAALPVYSLREYARQFCIVQFLAHKMQGDADLGGLNDAPDTTYIYSFIDVVEFGMLCDHERGKG